MKVGAEMWEVVAVREKSIFVELLGRTSEGKRGVDLQKEGEGEKS